MGVAEGLLNGADVSDVQHVGCKGVAEHVRRDAAVQEGGSDDAEAAL